MSLRQAVTYTGCSPSTLRRATGAGKLQCFRLVSGHRRWSQDQLDEFLGVEKEEGGKSRVYLYARSSDWGQAKGWNSAKGESREGEESILSRQVDRLRAYAQEHYGIEGILITDVGSGVNFRRPGFLKLVTALINRVP